MEINCFNEVRKIAFDLYEEIKNAESLKREQESQIEDLESETKFIERSETDWETVDILEMIDKDADLKIDFKSFSINKSEIIKRWKENKRQQKLEEEKQKLGSMSPNSQKKALMLIKQQQNLGKEQSNDDLDDQEDDESSEDDEVLLLDYEEDKNYKEELKIVETIIQKFLIGSESSFLVDVNILLMLKALPKKVYWLNID